MRPHRKAAKSRAVISRRQFCQSAALGLGGLAVGGCLNPLTGQGQAAGPLLPPVTTGNSVELCLNSRVSNHLVVVGGTASAQQIANVLWAAGKAPVTGSHRTIHAKTPDGSYIYHPEEHALEFYSREIVPHALRINYDRERDFDAGVSYMCALSAAAALWTGSQSQLASCPQVADLNFGIADVPGLTSQLVAVSSDDSLPAPATEGSGNLEDVLGALRLDAVLQADVELTPPEVSQLLWAGYGCTPHTTFSGRRGLTVPSWVAQYFLTNRVYVVDAQVARFCNRQGTDFATRDHRLELVAGADVRTGVRQALPDLPAAPCYFLLCLTSSGLNTWYQRLETGFAAGGMLLQAGALGLGCAFQADLSGEAQAALQQVTQIPPNEYPHAVVAIGYRTEDAANTSQRLRRAECKSPNQNP
jgi:hypothetical protein